MISLFFSPLFIMNFCVVMVIEGFYKAVSDNERIFTLDYLDKFIETWMKYEPKCCNIVKPYEFILILKELQPPIGNNYDWLIYDFGINRFNERNI